MRRPDRVTQAVVAVTALALLARLVGLGTRPFHWDEARVGYWTLRSLAVGAYEYRPVAGGPFLYVVGRWLVTLLGPSDAVARLPVALLGGLLPLAALLFRSAGEPDGRDAPVAGLEAAETLSLAVLLGHCSTTRVSFAATSRSRRSRSSPSASCTSPARAIADPRSTPAPRRSVSH